jgi:hypothetical protein
MTKSAGALIHIPSPHPKAVDGRLAGSGRNPAQLCVAAAIFLLLLTGNALTQGVQNGDFSDGLNGWISQGDVQVVDDIARLGDNHTTHSYYAKKLATRDA